MSDMSSGSQMPMSKFFGLFFRILSPERSFYWLAIIYGAGISLLSLATPISVQMLINTVANTALATPLIVLSLTLFGLLLVSGLLNALRIHLMELFGRRFYARMVAEISLRSIYAQNPFFGDTSRSALFNRYFDIVTVQKTVPVLFIGGFTVILQAGVGFVLVSLYHPLFLAFNLVIILAIWAIWLIWGPSAIRTGMDLSHRKHQTAAWLEGLGSSNGFFKSQKRIDFALQETDAKTRAYIDQHRKHFRRTFAQTLSFLILYASASAVLLGLGGWLVIQGQLTLGQLVAAELVLSAAFFGMSQLGAYLNYFYDLCAAVEELSLFYEVEQEEPAQINSTVYRDHDLQLVNACGEARGAPATFNFELPSGSTVMAVASNHGVQRLFTNLLKRHVSPVGGYVTLGGADLSDIEIHELRRDVFVLDRANFIEMTIRDYLQLSGDVMKPAAAIAVLEKVGLAPVIAQLEDGLDTRIASTGWPLSTAETMQLKLAGALLAQPRLLILGQLFDLIDEDQISEILSALRQSATTTVIYFSNRRHDVGVESYLYMDNHTQDFFNSFEAFCAKAHSPRQNLLARPPNLRKPDIPQIEEQ